MMLLDASQEYGPVLLASVAAILICKLLFFPNKLLQKKVIALMHI
jgi:hypothetical protein